MNIKKIVDFVNKLTKQVNDATDKLSEIGQKQTTPNFNLVDLQFKKDFPNFDLWMNQIDSIIFNLKQLPIPDQFVSQLLLQLIKAKDYYKYVVEFLKKRVVKLPPKRNRNHFKNDESDNNAPTRVNEYGEKRPNR